jgi:hypothetical protein
MDFVEDFELIAQRELAASSEDQVIKVFVRIAKPLEMPAGEWACPYQIVGLGDEVIRAIYGIDGVQALQLTMIFVAAELERLSKGLKLTFLGETDLGFPGFEVSK